MDFGDAKLLVSEDRLYQLENNTIVSSREIDYRNIRKSILYRPDGSIWVGLLKNRGLRRYGSLDAWQREEFDQLLPEKTVSHIYPDRKGGLWIGTIEHGVFHCPDPDMKIFDRSAGLPMDYVSAIAFGQKEELFIGLRNGQVFRLDMQTDVLTKLPNSPGQPIIYDLVFDKNENMLWAANGRNAYFQNGLWKNVKYYLPNKSSPDYVIGKRFTIRPGSNHLWGASNSRFGMIDVREKSIEVDAVQLGLAGRTLVAFEAADGRIWIGRPNGLYEFRDSQLVRPEPFYSQLSTRIDDLAELPDTSPAGWQGTLVIATKGSGLLLWRGDFFQQITEEDGLTTNMVENLHVDEQGRILAGSLQGLNRVTLSSVVSIPSANSTKPIVENFTTWHGLPSNEITMVRSRGDEVWIATTRGLMQWHEPPKNTSTEPPFFKA